MPAKAKTTAKSAPRASERPKMGQTGRGASIGIAAGALAVIGGLAAALRFGVFDRIAAAATRSGAEHPVPDLATDKPHNDGSARAPEAFRPDPTAPVSAAERDAFRPATVPIGGTPDRHTEAVH